MRFLRTAHGIFLICIFCLISSISSWGTNRWNCGNVNYYHSLVFNTSKHLDSWHIDDNGPFEYILQLNANWWKSAPSVNGWPIWCTGAVIDKNYNQSKGAIPGSACFFAIESCLAYYIYTGDSAFLNLAKKTGDYIVERDLTPKSFIAYPNFPYAVGATGSINPNGNGHPDSFSKYNIVNHIQPDKGAMLGFALVQLFKTTDDSKYLDAAINIANCLAKNVILGNDSLSPWPMRVLATDGTLIDGKFSANVCFACKLFIELQKLGKDTLGLYAKTRHNIWSWLKQKVILTQQPKWRNYFEDHSGDEDNDSQINALETARYLLEYQDTADKDWLNLSRKIIQQASRRWLQSDFDIDGYFCIAEQDKDLSPYNSHTARLGSVLALLSECMESREYRDTAYSSLCYSLYSIEDDGFTNTYFKKGSGAWTTDSFGDFLVHFISAIAAVPDWAGHRNILLRSSSTIKKIKYDTNFISYETFESLGVDKLILTQKPICILNNNKRFDAYTWDSITRVLTLYRVKCNNVTILFSGSPEVSYRKRNNIAISIYPNPTHNVLNIILPEKNEYNIYIVDLRGNILYSSFIKSDTASIDINFLKKGLYLVYIQNKEGSLFSHEFIVT